MLFRRSFQPSTIGFLLSKNICVLGLGKYHKTLTPGLHWLIPFADRPRKIRWRYLSTSLLSDTPSIKHVNSSQIDMREHLIDFGQQHVITKDTVQLEIDALVFFRIEDPVLAVLHVCNVPDMIELITQSTLRNLIAELTLDEMFSSRELVNAELLEKTKGDALRWGIVITRVEIQSIIPPNDIHQAMEFQIKEERDRRSAVLQAEGDMEAAIITCKGTAAKVILEAEGEKTASVQLAMGDAESKRIMADAEAQAIQELRQAMSQVGMEGSTASATEYLVAIQYLNSLSMLTRGGQSNVTFIPSQTTDALAGILPTLPHSSKQ